MELLEIGIVGVVLTAFIEWVKATFNPDSDTTRVITIALSLVLGAGIWFFSGTAWWQSMLGVLSTATIVWAFIIKK